MQCNTRMSTGFIDVHVHTHMKHLVRYETFFKPLILHCEEDMFLCRTEGTKTCGSHVTYRSPVKILRWRILVLKRNHKNFREVYDIIIYLYIIENC